MNGWWIAALLVVSLLVTSAAVSASDEPYCSAGKSLVPCSWLPDWYPTIEVGGGR